MSVAKCTECGRHLIWEHTLEERRACRKAQRLRWNANTAKRKPAPIKPPLVWTRLDDSPYPTIMNQAQLKQRIGAAKGGQTTQATGRSCRWTSETARAANLARKRYPSSGRFLGRAVKYRPAAKREPLRRLHAFDWGAKATYIPTEVEVSSWGILEAPTSLPAPVTPGRWLVSDDWGQRCVSERTALMRLGYLPKWYRRTAGVPTEVHTMGRRDNGPCDCGRPFYAGKHRHTKSCVRYRPKER